jgi:alkylhydroperoxidase family enzyme
MPFFASMPENAGPPTVFTKYPTVYGLFSQMSQELMNGPSPLTQGQRELILAYAAGVAECRFVYMAHSEVAYAWGNPRGLLDQLLKDLDSAPVEGRLKPLLRFVRKLMATPGEMTQADADAVFAAGWDEHALHDAIAVTARAAFMQRLVEGHGFKPWTQAVAAEHARKRVELGYVNLYPAFREKKT